MPPKTVDNLGPEDYERYAKDVDLLDKMTLDWKMTASSVSAQAIIDVVEPYLSSQIDQLISSPQTRLPLASFFYPRGYLTQKRELFTIQIIPSLGDFEKKEVDLERLKNYSSHESEKKDQKVLVTLLEKLMELERNFIDIISKIYQYQKG
jgi:hypothetical protein